MNNKVDMSGDGGGKKSKHKKSKVAPYSKLIESSTGLTNDGFEMDSIENEKDNKRKSFKMNKFKTTAAISMDLITNVQNKASRWKKYTNRRRLNGSAATDVHGQVGELGRKRTGGLGLDDIHENFVSKEAHSRALTVSSNRALIQLFAKLGQSKNDDEEIDLAFVESLLKNGAKIDCTDKYGQTIFHEIARAWHIDVAKFLIEHGANLNAADYFGRTPLHVAAAVDYPEMVQFLIENGAEKEARTKGEEQTPLYFAARNDACKSLKKLIQLGCEYKTIRDYKGRTPLHLAAELDRSETARLLLELHAPAGVTDECGQAALVWMITKMAPVAKEALDQFHTTDRANRKQYYFLNHLEPNQPYKEFSGCALTPLQSMVQLHQYELVTHPVVKRFIKTAWREHAKRGAWITLIINFLFILNWTLIALIVPYDKRHTYTFPDDWWRILLWILATVTWVYQIKDEMLDIYRSNVNFKKWRKWRLSEIERDIKFAHPRWPEEEEFLRCEEKEVDSAKPQYFNDFWNIFDWICYAFLLASIITHIIDIAMHSEVVARTHIRIMAFNIIILWLRLMKNARAFAALGPFIVILGHILSDCMKFLYLYLEFFIPFSCAFWMIFGGPRMSEADLAAGLVITNTTTLIEVDGYQTFPQVLFSMFRLTLVDEYDFANMLLVDGPMTYLLLCGWLALSAILCLNLFIALLSDTFQRVYDNAHANAVMQKAITVLNIQDNLTKKKRNAFREFIHTQCAPEKLYYDDDLTNSGEDDLKKATIQIREDLDELKQWWHDEFRFQGDEMEELEELKEWWHVEFPHGVNLDNNRNGGGNNGGGGGCDGSGSVSRKGRRSSTYDNVSLVSRETFENEIETLREEIMDIKDKQEELGNRFKRDCMSMKTLLFQIAAFQGVPGIPQSAIGMQPLTSRSESQAQTKAALDEWEKSEKQRRREYRLRKKETTGDSLLLTVDSIKDDSVAVQDQELTIPVDETTDGAAVPPEHQEPMIEVYTSSLPPYPHPRNPDSQQPAPEIDLQIRPTILNMEKMPASDC